jgi:hypothetical protein
MSNIDEHYLKRVRMLIEERPLAKWNTLNIEGIPHHVYYHWLETGEIQEDTYENARAYRVKREQEEGEDS